MMPFGLLPRDGRAATASGIRPIVLYHLAPPPRQA
jgi:hypothetical protein